MTPERGQVEVVIGGVHHVEAARETGIGVEDVPGIIAIEHADSGGFLAAEARGSEIVVAASRDLLRRERNAVVVVERVAAGRQPVKRPAHALLERGELWQRRARD